MNDKARPTSHSYFSQRLRLHYLDWGNPDAPHMLLIHGTNDHCHNWDWMAQEFASEFHVVAPDLRGHGDSEWCVGSNYHMLDYIYDLAQLVHQESLAPVHIISHSMGGTLGCLLAGLYPEKVASLVSIEGVGDSRFWHSMQDPPAVRVRNWVDSMRSLAGRVPRKYEALSDAFQRMQKSNPHLSEERARHLTIHGSNRNEDGTYSWKFDNYTHARTPYPMPYEDMASIFENISCPTLLLNAKQGFGHRTGQDDSLKYFKQGQVVDIDNAGHWVHHDQFEEVMTAIRSFLKEAMDQA